MKGRTDRRSMRMKNVGVNVGGGGSGSGVSLIHDVVVKKRSHG